MRVTQNAYFSLMTCAKQILLVTFCDTTAGIEASFQTHECMEIQIDMVVQVVTMGEPLRTVVTNIF